MPVSPNQILAALDHKRQDFTQFNTNLAQDLQRYRQQWQQLTATDPATVAAKLPREQVGARPLEPFAAVAKGVIPFSPQWPSREASLEWVRSQITGITTFAVDGSQIFPTKELSLPVALIQIGWFENPHQDSGTYRKDVALEVLSPQDLKAKGMADPVDRRVNIRRFELETERLVDYMAHCADPDRTLVFFDGSLVVTFADVFDEDSQQAYVQAMGALLRASDRHRVPLVGYVDTSTARDLTTLIPYWSASVAPVEGIYDAQMLRPLMKWGDRTPLCLCDRKGILDHYGDQADQVTFTYLQTSRERPPVRVELPRWLWESQRLEPVLNWVRSEVIIGGGYPYAIETADQTAVLQGSDRQLFYRILQEWADRENLSLRFSRKLASKTRRR